MTDLRLRAIEAHRHSVETYNRARQQATDDYVTKQRGEADALWARILPGTETPSWRVARADAGPVFSGQHLGSEFCELRAIVDGLTFSYTISEHAGGNSFGPRLELVTWQRDYDSTNPSDRGPDGPRWQMHRVIISSMVELGRTIQDAEADGAAFTDPR